MEWRSGINDWVLKNALLVNIEKPKDKKSKGSEGKKGEEKVEITQKLCMHPECYSVLAVQDKKGDDYKELGVVGEKMGETRDKIEEVNDKEEQVPDVSSKGDS